MDLEISRQFLGLDGVLHTGLFCMPCDIVWMLSCRYIIIVIREIGRESQKSRCQNTLKRLQLQQLGKGKEITLSIYMKNSDTRRGSDFEHILFHHFGVVILSKDGPLQS